MNDAALFEATVPVFQHYTERIDALLSVLPDEHCASLEQRLAPNAFTSGEHLQTALGFVSRTVFPLLGRDTPLSEDGAADRSGLVRYARRVSSRLDDMTVADFHAAASCRLSHTAGMAELEQDATTFVTLFSLPNFFFHLSMAFAILRHAGVDIGKADFDGQHVCAAGFHFQ